MTDSLSIFRSGSLLMPAEEPAALPGAAEAGGGSFLGAAFIVITMLFCMVLLRNIIHALPGAFGSLVRWKGSAAVESSVHLARDRNMTAILMILPFVVIVDRSGLYAPEFLQGIDENIRLLFTLLVFLAYLILRVTLYVELKPRRGHDSYLIARKAAWNLFIVLVTVMAATFSILSFFHINALVVRIILWAEIGTVYLFLLIRRSQILSASCNPFTTFLYLCALEILPTGLLVASAIFL